MFLKWGKKMFSDGMFASTYINKDKDKIIISITHNGNRDKDDEYRGLITLRRGDRHNEIFTHHFVAHGETDEEVFTDAENQVMKIFEREIKTYKDACDTVVQAMIGFKGVDNSDE